MYWIYFKLAENTSCKLLLPKNSLSVGLQNPSLLPDTSSTIYHLILSSLNPFMFSYFYLTHSKPSLSSVNTPSLSSHVVPPCLLQSSLLFALHPTHHTAVREHLEKPSKLVCLPCCHPHLPKSPTTEPRRDVLQLAHQRKVEIQDGVGCQLFPAHLQPQ